MHGSSISRSEPRSMGTLAKRRVPLPWPEDRHFRILAIDGGGIRGIFPAAVLSRLEQNRLAGASVAGYFDLVAGASTGGIVGLGLAAGRSATDLLQLYCDRGSEIFPPLGPGLVGRARRRFRAWRRCVRYSYERDALERILREVLGELKLGAAQSRLSIPSFDGEHGEVYIFKTPHHPDFRKDLHETMVKVALATSAAPTYFRPLEDAGYIFVDGGVWANNPVMVALVEALSSFNVAHDQVRILSIGCGADPYRVTRGKIVGGGMWHWRDIFNAAMSLQSQNALGQAGLLIGRENLLRLDVPRDVPPIELDDWRRAVDYLRPAGFAAADAAVDRIAEVFLGARAAAYVPTAYQQQ